MSARLTPTAFVAAYLGRARQAYHATGVSPWVILAQWAVETGWGSSALAARHNLAGIEYYGHPGSYPIGDGKGRTFAGYDSFDAFTLDYIRTLNLPYYHAVRAIPMGHDTFQGTIRPQCLALGRSPWDAGHYTLRGLMGGSLIAAWSRLAPVAHAIHEAHTRGVTVSHVAKVGE